MEQEFHRIKRLPPHVFAEVNELKARARAAGEDIIDFGMGNPDQPPPPHVVEKMAEALMDPRIHRYSTSRGIPGLRRANAAYYGRRFGVAVDPGLGFGEYGEGFVRLGPVENRQRIRQALRSVKTMLRDDGGAAGAAGAAGAGRRLAS